MAEYGYKEEEEELSTLSIEYPFINPNEIARFRKCDIVRSNPNC